MSDASCLFCKIIRGEIPADLVHSDEVCVAIRDIDPKASTHVLVIPREHMESLNEATHRDEEMLGHLLRIGARIANEEGHSDDGYRIVINTGAGAGQSVFHLHIHVLAGRPMNWPPG
jgi:histidine triad (HIT) family protein